MCNGLHTHAELKRDPTQTTTLRNRFEADAYKRFRTIKGRIRDEIIKEDGFGLKTNRGRFEFERSSAKVEAFMEWLREQEREQGLVTAQGTRVENAADKAWTATYIQTAYQRGIGSAAKRMRKGGVNVEDSWEENAFNRPIHADRVGLAYTRSFRQLQGITETMDQQISRELAQGLAEGQNPREIARRLNNRVDKVGITRARTLARTEVISAHAEASINAYEEAGVDGVNVQAEFSTAGDGRVCTACASLEGRVYDLDEARGLIPVHPNCRCALIPYLPDSENEDERQEQLAKKEERRKRLKSEADKERAKARANPPKSVTDNRKKIVNRLRNEPSEVSKRKWLDSVRDNPPDDFDGRRRRLVDNWTRGSKRKVSVEMKQAARRELGFGGIDYSRANYNLDEGLVKQSMSDVRSIYSNTQKAFASQGQKTVRLYRGLKSNVTTPGSVESWTTDRRIAESFNGGAVIVEDVPVDRILTGKGMPDWEDGPYGDQKEFLVLGGGA